MVLDSYTKLLLIGLLEIATAYLFMCSLSLKGSCLEWEHINGQCTLRLLIAISSAIFTYRKIPRLCTMFKALFSTTD